MSIPTSGCSKLDAEKVSERNRSTFTSVRSVMQVSNIEDDLAYEEHLEDPRLNMMVSSRSPEKRLTVNGTKMNRPALRVHPSMAYARRAISTAFKVSAS